MPTATWPATLPQKVEIGYTQSIGANILRTPMDLGPSKVRYRGVRPKKIKCSMFLTDTQISIFDTFITSTLKGVFPFNFPDPLTGTTKLFRILPESDGYYNITHVGGTYYKISFELEQIL